MYTIQDIRAEYDRLDRIMGIDSSDVEIRISRSSVRQLGCFRTPGSGARGASGLPARISISASVLEDRDQFYDTIRHEYAHMAAYKLYPNERHQHDLVWKSICRRIGCAPRSRTGMTETQEQEWQDQARFRIHCPACGADSWYLREGKYVRMMRRGMGSRIRCGRCGAAGLELYVRE